MVTVGEAVIVIVEEEVKVVVVVGATHPTYLNGPGTSLLLPYVSLLYQSPPLVLYNPSIENHVTSALPLISTSPSHIR